MRLSRVPKVFHRCLGMQTTLTSFESEFGIPLSLKGPPIPLSHSHLGMCAFKIHQCCFKDMDAIMARGSTCNKTHVIKQEQKFSRTRGTAIHSTTHQFRWLHQHRHVAIEFNHWLLLPHTLWPGGWTRRDLIPLTVSQIPTLSRVRVFLVPFPMALLASLTLL